MGLSLMTQRVQNHWPPMKSKRKPRSCSVLKEAKEAGHLAAAQGPALGLSLEDVVGQLADANTYGKLGKSIASMLTFLHWRLWLHVRMSFSEETRLKREGTQGHHVCMASEREDS